MAGRVEHASRAGPEFPGPVERAAGTAEPTGRHLHLDDYPQTLELLRALVGHRADRDELGYTPTEHGAFVDWDRLTTGKLSSTEQATAQIARGCATLERAGGPPPQVAGVLVAVVTAGA